MSDLTIEQLEHYKVLMEPTPPFLEALIAEKQAHQKLRAEIGEVLDVVKYETWLHDDWGKFPEAVQMGSYVAGQLTRILEAGNG